MANSSSGSSEAAQEPSAGGALRSLAPTIARVEEALRQAVSDGRNEAQVAIALRFVSRFEVLLERIIKDLVDQDLAERATVYHLITARCAEFLGRPADELYPAVLELCGESDDKLTDGLGAPHPEASAILARALLHVTVTYALDGGSRTQRTLSVYLNDAGEGLVREQRLEEALPWDAVPEDVRERLLRDGRRPVTFTLYPGTRQ